MRLSQRWGPDHLADHPQPTRRAGAGLSIGTAHLFPKRNTSRAFAACSTEGEKGGGEEKEKKAGCSPTAWASMLAMLLALWIRQGGRARRAGRGNNKGSSPKLVLRPEVTHDS